jgi:hypothetical protein
MVLMSENHYTSENKGNYCLPKISISEPKQLPVKNEERGTGEILASGQHLPPLATLLYCSTKLGMNTGRKVELNPVEFFETRTVFLAIKGGFETFGAISK